MTHPILDETRSIKRIIFRYGGDFEVGEDGITKIEAYAENEQKAKVSYVAVYRENELYRRIPMSWVMVEYDAPEPATSSSNDEFPPDEELPFHNND